MTEEDEARTEEVESEGTPEPVEPEDPLVLAERERDELRDTLQRVQADFENFRKRVMRDQAAHAERAHETLVEQLLTVLDSFELAVLNIPEGELDDTASKLRRGVELVFAELVGVVEKAGLERIEARGKPFNPEEHEAVLRDEGEAGGDGPLVTEVLRTGYRFKGRVLRPAMVRVGSAAG
ncbi:MAG: nucleotide exchange factor GrpE [Actinobacteria bacterium]|nr:nucleotide exchange factor GrpE [Actinomycetota bacterium]